MLLIMCDASCKGNPGISKAGVVVWQKINGKRKTTPDYKFSVDLGIQTNNQAEWLAVLEGVKFAKQKGEKEIFIYSDSLLVVNQAKGKWKIKDIKMKELKSKFDKEITNLDIIITWLPIACPFCGGEMEYHCDDMGGEWVEHKIKHVDGKKDPCILTGLQIDFSAEWGMTWNNRVPILSVEEILEFLTQAHIKGYHSCCQRDASYSNARADCQNIAERIHDAMKEGK